MLTVASRTGVLRKQLCVEQATAGAAIAAGAVTAVTAVSPPHFTLCCTSRSFVPGWFECLYVLLVAGVDSPFRSLATPLRLLG